MVAPHDALDADSARLPARGVVLAATPLGNIGDASDRLRAALAGADVVAAEDTRRTRALAAALGVEITGRVVSNFDHNEDARAADLIAAARNGVVLVVTDAGMPIVSDPGLSIVAAAHDADVPVTCIPGPSAVTTALALSGLNVGHFIFDGFAPRKSGARRAWLESLVQERRAVCCFESPHRIEQLLIDAAAVLGPDRRAAVCRELTKTYEEVKRGALGELAEWAAEGVRGEITLVIEGGAAKQAEPEELLGAVAELVDNGARLKDAVKEVAKANGVKVGDLYDAALANRE
ncbi:16S rRNA (cytidine(1402)-2'-O)-methyltransferase [Corynebacterium sp. Marseille-P4321]|uniref:16S rRNA (cytidine(1402)-2'-O)-methyltransferase n=1 Tax=Corynebacterium sp. Marseille-P4321 TaxID=2736603 RepID=UPI001588BD44|nr:16S rRNA (cytidine(1402)-2'-O)-methyltransferase [Corynebacterium sp. Marseille-P4321]